MNVVTIDFETYYDSEYTLSKLTTQEYLYDQRFEVIGVAMAIGNANPVWFSGDFDSTKKFLQQIDWPNTRCIAHNAIFDGGILELIFDLHPAEYFCTMMGSRPNVVPFSGTMSLAGIAKYFNFTNKGTYVSAARGMRRKDFGKDELNAYANYCVGDVIICRDIAKKISPDIPAKEKKVLDLRIKKYTRPKFLLDIGVIQHRLAQLLIEKEGLLAAVGLHDRDALMSNDKFAELLQHCGVTPPTKWSDKQQKEIYAFAKTDQGMKDLSEHPSSQVQALVAARLGHKSTLEETRLRRFLTLATIGKPLSVPLLYYGAHTGRDSGLDKLNLQNLTRGSDLRRALIAPPGYKVIAADLSQIEARLVATVAGQTDLVIAFARGDDVYSMFATDLYKRPIDKKKDPDERFVGKTGILQLGYGAGGPKFHLSVSHGGVIITELEAQRVVDTYRARYSRIKNLWRTATNMLDCMIAGDKMTVGPVTTLKEKLLLPNDMVIHYPELYKSSGEYFYRKGNAWVKIYGGAFVENFTQALARIVISDAEVKLASRGIYAVLQVHDELIFIVPDAHVNAVSKSIKLVMEATVPWLPELPVACEVGVGQNYGDAK